MGAKTAKLVRSKKKHWKVFDEATAAAREIYEEAISQEEASDENA